MFALRDRTSGNLLRIYYTHNEILSLCEGNDYNQEVIFVLSNREAIEEVAVSKMFDLPAPSFERVRNSYFGNCDVVELEVKS